MIDTAIRAEKDSDLAAIRRVHESAFPTRMEADLVDRLRAGGKLLVSLVAVREDQIVGHIAFSPVTIEPAVGTASGVGLAPVAVLPSEQRKGVGSQLIEAGVVACRDAGHEYIVVLGWPEYYPRFGFEPARTRRLDNEYGAGDEFMVMELVPNVLSTRRRLVRYCHEFSELS